jgi:hypothetical protein
MCGSERGFARVGNGDRDKHRSQDNGGNKKNE